MGKRGAMGEREGEGREGKRRGADATDSMYVTDSLGYDPSRPRKHGLQQSHRRIRPRVLFRQLDVDPIERVESGVQRCEERGSRRRLDDAGGKVRR